MTRAGNIAYIAPMPESFKRLARYFSSLLFGAAGFFGAKLAEVLMGLDLSVWMLTGLAAACGLLSVFAARIAEWLWGLYKRRRLRHLLFLAAALLIVAWLGWPWPRVQNTFADIRLKQPLVSEKWMSEDEAEAYVIEKLRSGGSREVFLHRARSLIVHEMRANGRIGRFWPAGDSLWHPLGYHEVYAIKGMREYDGSVKLSVGLNSLVQFSTERIHLTDWVGLDSSTGYFPLYPN